MCIFSGTAKEHIDRYLNGRKDNLTPFCLYQGENNRWSKRRAMQVFVRNYKDGVLKVHNRSYSKCVCQSLTHLRKEGCPLEDQLIADRKYNTTASLQRMLI